MTWSCHVKVCIVLLLTSSTVVCSGWFGFSRGGSEVGKDKKEVPIPLSKVSDKQMAQWIKKTCPSVSIVDAKTLRDRQRAFDYVVYILGKFNLTLGNAK